MSDSTIKEVRIEEDGQLLIYPSERDCSGTYQYVYRAAMGVYWDEEKEAFFMKQQPQSDWTYVMRSQNILKAVKSELGITLATQTNTIWSNVDVRTREAIER